jgi:hypothetical protein
LATRKQTTSSTSLANIDNRDMAAAAANDPRPGLQKPARFDPSSSRETLIATAAYYRAQRRGFSPGSELEDWLAAEREVDGTGRIGT